MKNLFLFFLLLIMTACSQKTPKELTISTNSWIGYTPLFYAQEKGYLDKLHIKLITTVSLAHSAKLYLIRRSDITTMTQHEYNTIKDVEPTFRPIILIDRSNGGDMILANRSIKALQKSKKITAYLEIGSINRELLERFIKEYHLDIKKFKFINKDQAQIADVHYTKENPILIVTYTPYNAKLLKSGFKEIASTRDIHDLMVIDAMGTNQETLHNNRKRLLELKKVIDKSIQEIQENPKEAYTLTNKYLDNISYAEYQSSMKSIKWIDHPSSELLHQLQKISYTKSLL